ncbi:2,3-bisphosphoglycerate-independent phosphoglycerate mutase [Pneumocystis murina B123]|uniref:2,3-bisphosphoglycerate-independent phosphoglycerate mutase n=1 Tax=Pneumocystis murina (strain B123) TaxID=1069680 RepID=M7PD04_PNEMU|nr:2,3-bisphosphoglycerate-independent phosphoglycerate mutase [Pneumocystis murina B123]EMR08329.1 2,3-bisphosphoglycerate-independent phosphoglycerate mutase [Pneumocystis murina B123]
MAKPLEKVCLICIDGWGINPKKNSKEDAISAANIPIMSSLMKKYSSMELKAHGNAVGLTEGLMGNSEVGHLNIGAGRIVWQDLVRIDKTVKNKGFIQVEAIVSSMERSKAGNGRFHILGLVSDGGVHSHINHLFHLLETAKEIGLKEVYIHFFSDGRDTSPLSSIKYVEQLMNKIKDLGIGELATIVGRYYAMDRDKRWERITIALEGIIYGIGEEDSDVINVINRRYQKNETDEFLKPIIVNKKGCISDGDTLFFFNYRSDRVRQITQVLGVDSTLTSLQIPKNLSITTMTQYKVDYPFPVAFPPQKMDNVLAEWLSKKGILQSHVAETEKYAHVTFFFNGGVEKQFEGEQRDMVPSPKVSTYDKDPKMSVDGVAQKISERITENKYPFIMCNLAPPDMVGHVNFKLISFPFTINKIRQVYMMLLSKQLNILIELSELFIIHVKKKDIYY